MSDIHMPTDISKVRYDRHYFTTTSARIKSIVTPLSKFGVRGFDHFRIYDDNSAIDLTTIPEFCEFFGRNGLYKFGCAGNFDDYQNGYFFWDTLSSVEVFQALAQQCHVSHGMTIVKKYDNYCDHFYLGGDINNPGIKNFFINQMDVIETFIAYYYQEATDIISNARPHSYCFPDNKTECQLMTVKGSYSQQHLNELKQELLLKITNLTPRELQCVYQSALGESAKETAARLNISNKTVENHLDNARKKMSVTSKSALIRDVIYFHGRSNGF